MGKEVLSWPGPSLYTCAGVRMVPYLEGCLTEGRFGLLCSFTEVQLLNDPEGLALKRACSLKVSPLLVRPHTPQRVK